MRRYLNWKSLLLLIAVVIAFVSLLESNKLVKDMEKEEYRNVQHYISAVQAMYESGYEPGGFSQSSSGVTLASKIITGNTSPIIITDLKGNILTHNLDSAITTQNPQYLAEQLALFNEQHGKIFLNDGYNKQYLYYGDSEMLTRIKNYPVILLLILAVFFLVIIVAISNAQRNIQNQVWVGMSKETAHQLGTPLTSVVAWMELLKENEDNRPYIEEMEKDVERLQLVADRFSKIGSVPQLREEDLVARLKKMVHYMQKRAPLKVAIHFDSNEPEIEILLIGPLFDWVIENLMRNALDAMEGSGEIYIKVNNEPRLVTIDICDTGKGIPKNKFKKVFQPGYSTKMRGWGLGLSLAKRIIEKYHKGSIFVKSSDPDKGTTFRIILRR